MPSFLNNVTYRRLGAVFIILFIHVSQIPLPLLAATENKQIVAGVLENWPPHYIMAPETHKPSGFAVDIMKAVGRLSSLDIKYEVFHTWSEVNTALREKKIDVIPNMGITEERLEYLRFTIPVETSRILFFIRKTTTDIRTEEDLIGRTVCVVGINKARYVMEERGWKNLKIFPSFEQALMSLLSGNSDAFVYPDPPLMNILQQHGLGDKVKAIGEPLLEVKRALCVHKDDTELIHILDDAVQTLMASNEFKKIYSKWYGNPTPFWSVKKVAALMGATLVIVGILLFLWRYQSISQLNKKLINQTQRRMKSEANLGQTQRMLSAIMDHSPALISVKDTDGRIILVNKQFAVLEGPSPEAFIGQSVFDIFSPHIASELWENDHAALESVMPLEAEETFKHTDGTWHTYLTVRFPLMDSDEKCYGVCAISTDITDRNRAEKSLRTSEQRLALALEASGAGIYDHAVPLDSGMYHSERWAEILGYAVDDLPPHELFMEWLSRQIHPDDLPHATKAYAELVAGEREIYDEEARLLHKSGGWILTRALSKAVRRDDRGRATRIVGVMLDITERRQMEAQLRQQQKLESIGTLAGGVAHEINNPINGIMNYAQLLKDKSKGNALMVEFADEIIHETKRIATIVKNLLTFARHDKESHSPARVQDIVNRTMSLIQAVFRKDQIALIIDIPKDLPEIKCRSQQIEQVLMNLMTNARDALNEKFPEYDEEKKITISSAVFEKNAQRWIRTSVEDRGTGIPREIKERIFDPFFTTKPKEVGTGLGLSISYGIVQEHHGHLSVETVPGKYARFHVDLPVDNGWTTENIERIPK